MIIFIYMPLWIYSVNAPVTTITTISNAVVNQQVTVPLTVTGFNNVGGMTLTIDYQYSKLHYISGTYNPAFVGYCSIGDLDLGNGTHRLTISWTGGGASVSLPDGSWIVKYVFLFLNGPAPLTFFDNGPSCVYSTPSATPMNDIPYASYYINGSVYSSLPVNLKIFLEGPYISNSMSTSLRINGLIPLTQPYTGSPWNYTGTENVAALPGNVTDWILVELRSGTASASKIAMRAGFILSTGAITDLDGTSPLAFSGISPGSYYIVVRHRNHMPVMTASAVALSSSAVLYDFTIGSGQVYGGASGFNLIDPTLSLWGMISGDASNEGSVYVDDFTDSWIPVFGSTNIYSQGDFRMDGNVLNDDYTDNWVPNFGKSNILP